MSNVVPRCWQPKHGKCHIGPTLLIFCEEGPVMLCSPYLCKLRTAALFLGQLPVDATSDRATRLATGNVQSQRSYAGNCMARAGGHFS